MSQTTLVTGAMVAKACEVLDDPGAPARELHRLAQEEPLLAGLITSHLALIARLMVAWGAPQEARERAIVAGKALLASLSVAWRMGLLSRWEREAGIEIDPKEGA